MRITFKAGLACAYWLALATFAMPAAGQAVPVDEGAAITAGDNPDDYGPRPPATPADPDTFPRLANGRPDFTGLWWAGIKDLTGMDDNAMVIPLQPEYRDVWDRRKAATAAGEPYPDYVSTCQAFGMPRIMAYGLFEFVARDEQLWVISEVLHEVRRIYTDGQPHGQLQLYSFNGVSNGHWEGDTLVVRTDRLREGYLNMGGIPHSDQMVVTERIRMVNANAIENEMTITDPVALTEPWTMIQRYDRRPAGYEMAEYNCLENYQSGGLNVDPASDPGLMLPPSAITRP